jgi:hypothetical protein
MGCKTTSLMVGVLLITSLISGVCTGEEAPGYEILIQGVNNIFTEGGDDSVLTIEDTNPYAVYLTDMSFLKQIDTVIPSLNGSMNAAIVRNGEDNQSTSIVTVSNPVYSKDTKELTFRVKPLEFYEGARLKNFMGEKQNLTSDKTGKVTLTRIYLEINQKVPENGPDDLNSEIIDQMSTPLMAMPGGGYQIITLPLL